MLSATLSVICCLILLGINGNLVGARTPVVAAAAHSLAATDHFNRKQRQLALALV